MNRRALVRRPSPRLAEGLLTHLDRVAVDVDLAQRQWEAYVAALQAEGWETIEVPPAPDCPDSVFVEDTVVMYGDLAVLTRPGADERRAEVAGTEQTLRDLGLRIARIESPGTLDGGDVLKHDGTVWVGLGGRTNQAGIDQLAAHLAPLGASVVAVPLTKALHLKSAVTALPDGTVVGWEQVVDDRVRVGLVPRRPGGAGLARRAARRGDRADVVRGAPDACAVRGARTAGGRRRRHGVREARGLRHLPVRAPARLTTPSSPVQPGPDRPTIPVPLPLPAVVARRTLARGTDGGSGTRMGEPSLELTPQTAALAGAADALEQAGLEHWFFGGWAVDLWVGRLTRPHDDIDVLVRRADEAAVDAALGGGRLGPHAP